MNTFFRFHFHLRRSRWSITVKMCSPTVSMSSVYAPANFPISAKTVFISIINTLGPFHKPKIITLNSKITCKSRILTIFFWHLRLPISRHQINTSINQKAKGVRFFFITRLKYDQKCTSNNKSANLLCRPNINNLSAGLNNLSAGLNNLSAGLNNLSAGLNNLSAGLNNCHNNQNN